MIEPTTLIAGDSTDWVRTEPDYPATDWQGTYALFNATHTYGFQTMNVAGGHWANLLASETAAWAEGRYDWTFYLTNKLDAEKRVSITSGRIVIKANPATGGARDGRTHAEKMLDAINGIIENKASKSQLDMVRVAHNGRDWEGKPELLMQWRDLYAAEVRREQQARDMAAGQGGKGMRVRVRF